ncbi:MAG TPA: hypothetical protein VGI68_06100, partial [Mycobacterium sp.]
MEDQQPAAGDLTADAAPAASQAAEAGVTKESHGDDSAEHDETEPAATESKEVPPDEVDGDTAEQPDGDAETEEAGETATTTKPKRARVRRLAG